MPRSAPQWPMRLGCRGWGSAGRKIALYLPNLPYHPYSLFAVLKAGWRGGASLAVDAERELAHKLKDSGARTLITTNIAPMLMMAQKLLAAGHVELLIVGDDTAFGAAPGLPVLPIPGDDPRILDFAQLLGGVKPEAWPCWTTGARGAAIYRGTTGMPKGAIHTHATLRASLGFMTSSTARRMSIRGSTTGLLRCCRSFIFTG